MGDRPTIAYTKNALENILNPDIRKKEQAKFEK